jgi:surfactin synthase thioesterase subunit
VSCPIAALAARTDPQVAPGQMAGWQLLTTGRFDLQIVEGGHFFPRERPQLVLPTILAP